jgi:hypothetical protein
MLLHEGGADDVTRRSGVEEDVAMLVQNLPSKDQGEVLYSRVWMKSMGR